MRHMRRRIHVLSDTTSVPLGLEKLEQLHFASGPFSHLHSRNALIG